MSQVRMYCTDSCPFCAKAERLLERKGVTPEKIRIDTDPERFEEMVALAGRDTVPQVFVGERHLGGFDDLVDLDLDGELDLLLKGA